VTRPIIIYYVKYGPQALGLAEGVDPCSWASSARTAGAGLAAVPPGGECPPTPQNANGSHRALGHPHCKNPNLKVIA
jgi:hypothetical protein